jgi:hypothetical protein
MDRLSESEGLDIVRKALDDPHAEAYLAPDRLQQEIHRLRTRLARVQRIGGAYGSVGFSEDVQDLLGRLEAGATLSTAVH